jgi:hypothetical protein
MADWFVSSAAYAALPQFAISTAYTVGQIIRPLTAQAVNAMYVFRCTVAGTSAATEPAWPVGNNVTIASGGATFANVSGQSAYGWGAAAGSLVSLGNGGNNRFVAGDRAFLSSDHSETTTSGGSTYGFSTPAPGVIEVISVNRAGSVPPAAADQLSGASIIGTTTATLYIDAYVNNYWQGITFNLSGTGTFAFNNFGVKTNYLKNCSIILGATALGIHFNNPGHVVFDNTTVQFGAASQGIQSTSYLLDFSWLNTSAALQGATFPTSLFSLFTPAVTCRGVDLSALTTALVATPGNTATQKVLLDSCRIAPSVTRYGGPGSGGLQDEIELVNCYDGTHIFSERHTAYGDINTDTTVTMVGGAQDDVGLYSLKLVSNTNVGPWVGTLDTFWFDVENTLVGTLRTATIEILSLATLNNIDISLALEYQATAGSSLAAFGFSLPSALTALAALPTSTAAWNNPPLLTWNPADLLNITLSGTNNLTATTGAATGAVRTTAGQTSGKYYFEYSCTNWTTSIGVGVANPNAALGTVGASPFNAAFVQGGNGNVWINGVNQTTANLGVRANGDVIAVAVDLTNSLIWFRVAPSGNWNASGTANPATGVGGLSIVSIQSSLLPLFGLFANAASTAGLNATANFGGSAFSGAVPAGFTSGFPPTVQHLQVVFTPQQAGRLRAQVRLGRLAATVWVNPQVLVT